MDLRNLPLDDLTVAGIWNALDPEARRLGARAVYEGGDGDRAGAVEADAAIARAVRFRLVAVRRLPIDKRADYLARVVRPDESLASLLLRALHFGHRRELLAAFLDALAIPHQDGVIDPDYDFEAHRPEAGRLAAALAPLDARFPREEIDLYALTLLAMDRGAWAPLAEVLARRWGKAAAAGGAG